MDRSHEEDRAIREIVDRLAKNFPHIPSEEVDRAVQQARPEFEDSPIRDFVPLFIERNAKHHLSRATT